MSKDHHSQGPAPTASKHTILRLAAEACCCVESAEKALKLGAKSVRGLTGERIAAAAARLGLELGSEGQ